MMKTQNHTTIPVLESQIVIAAETYYRVASHANHARLNRLVRALRDARSADEAAQLRRLSGLARATGEIT